MSPHVRLELEQLLSGLCDGTLDEPEQTRLESLLAADPGCRRHYLEYIDLHARLLVSPNRLGGAPLPPPAELAAKPSTSSTSPRPPRRGGKLRPAVQYLALVVATLTVSLLLQHFAADQSRKSVKGGSPPPADVATSSANAPPALATMTQTADAAWVGSGPPRVAGARLGPGELHLAKGLVRLRFDIGPELLLEGPAVLSIDAGASATIRQGRVVFRADDTGPPFELHTPTSTLVDLGTEYGVFVSTEGEEIHVFEGEVRRMPRTGHAGEPELLGAGEARRYRNEAAGAPAVLEPSQFVRRLPRAAQFDAAAGLLAYEGFEYAEPDALAKGKGTGGTGWAGPWRGPRTFFKPPGPNRQPAINTKESLTRPGGVAVGGTFEFTGFTQYSRRLATPLLLNDDQVYFFSFLFRRLRPPPDAYNAFTIALRPGDDGPRDREEFCKRLSIGIGGENQLFTHMHGVGSRVPLPLSYGQTYLMVTKIVAHRGRPCQVFIRVYGAEEPVEREETALWTAAGHPIRSDMALEWIELTINGRRRQQLDELRIGTTWASVTSPWAAPADRAGP